MNKFKYHSGITKKLIFSTLFFINFIQSSKSADFGKINPHKNDQGNQYDWLKKSHNLIYSDYSEIFLKNKSNEILNKKNFLDKNSELLLADLSPKREELVIQSDKQSEINDVISNPDIGMNNQVQPNTTPPSITKGMLGVVDISAGSAYGGLPLHISYDSIIEVGD